MKKKGFTLVELLAVIAILAILVIMALPAVLKMFNKARIDSFTNELNTVIKATRQQYLLDGGKTQTYTNANGSTNKLNITGNGELKYLIKVDGSGNVTRFQATSGDYCYNKSGTIDVVNSEDIKSNECTLNIDDNYVSLTDAVFIPGDEFTVKIKQIAGDDTSENGAGTLNTNITAIIKSNNEPIESNKTEEHIVSTSDSRYPIYAWYDNGTIYWWSEDNTPSLNDNSRRMFYNMTKLNDIEGLSTFDTSNASKINIMFTFDDLRSIEPLRNWNTSKVTAMGNLLYKNENLNSIKALENWDTSGATSLAGMFYFLTSLESLEGIEKWDVSNVTNMNLTFNNTRIKSVLPLKNWNTSKVTTMEYTFSGCEKLENLDGLENWDTSNVNTMFLTFNYCVSLENMNGIKNWNVSKVTNMHQLFSSTVNLTTVDLSNWSPDSLEIMSNIFGMWNNDGTARLDSKLTYVDISSFSKAPLTDITMAFSNTVNLTKINGIENLKTDNVTSMHHAFSGTLGLKSLDLSKWNTSNVTKMNSMFAGSGLEELDISGFDTRNVTNFSSMFNRSTNLKHIYVGPNWDTSSNIEGTETVFPEISDLPNFDTNNSDYRDLSYAHTGEGGYLTLKTN
jgi:prepilin-type N-terminal cleavage/methylation domain-containing protein